MGRWSVFQLWVYASLDRRRGVVVGRNGGLPKTTLLGRDWGSGFSRFYGFQWGHRFCHGPHSLDRHWCLRFPGHSLVEAATGPGYGIVVLMKFMEGCGYSE